MALARQNTGKWQRPKKNKKYCSKIQKHGESVLFFMSESLKKRQNALEESYRETPVGILKIYQNSDGCNKFTRLLLFLSFFLHKEMIEQSDHSSNSKYRNNGSNANSNQFCGQKIII